MRRLNEKLHDRSGASLLFAILVFMLCILAGTAALTAAAANAGRYTHLESEQQTYLTISSAVRLMKDEVAGTTLTVTRERGGTTTVEAEPVGHWIGEIAGDLVAPVFGGSPTEKKMTVSGLDGMADVTVTVTMDASCTLKMTLKLDSYFVTVTFPALIESDETVTDPSGARTGTVKFTWPKENVFITGLGAKA